jgi:hypothetical protein
VRAAFDQVRRDAADNRLSAKALVQRTIVSKGIACNAESENEEQRGTHERSFTEFSGGTRYVAANERDANRLTTFARMQHLLFAGVNTDHKPGPNFGYEEGFLEASPCFLHARHLTSSSA